MGFALGEFVGHQPAELDRGLTRPRLFGIVGLRTAPGPIVEVVGPNQHTDLGEARCRCRRSRLFGRAAKDRREANGASQPPDSMVRHALPPTVVNQARIITCLGRTASPWAGPPPCTSRPHPGGPPRSQYTSPNPPAPASWEPLAAATHRGWFTARCVPATLSKTPKPGAAAYYRVGFQVFRPVKSTSSFRFSLRSPSMVSRLWRAAASRPRMAVNVPSTARLTVELS